MQQSLREVEFAGRVAPGMDVCDISGEKIGTVANVHRRTGPLGEDRVIEVKTGLLGLGKHFYLPMSTVQEVTQGCVFLSKPADEVKGTEAWQQKPPYLDELH